MSYGISAALQASVYGHLSGDFDLNLLVGDAIFDAEPAGVLPEIYVSLGPETVRPKGDAIVAGAVHEFIISVVTDAAGFATAKAAAGVISDLLIDADLALDRGDLISLRFLRAKAVRQDGGKLRRIDLAFRARVDDV